MKSAASALGYEGVLDRAYARTDRAAVPLLIEALDWLRRGLEQMAPDDKIGGAHAE